MNESDAINTLCYALQEIEIIAAGGNIGLTHWGDEDEQTRLVEITEKVSAVRAETRAAGLWQEANL